MNRDLGMHEEMTLDIYADENEPVAQQAWITYRLALPDEVRKTMKSGTQPIIYVEVDEYGMVNLDDSHSYWFGEPLSKSVYEVRREIWEWLVEWEFARWIKIGPDDRELFALKKLTGEDYEYER